MGSLAQVLRDLPGFGDPNLLVGLERFDDAGVYRLRDDLAIVQTVDFFPPLVDDPYDFGRISAANSLSDVYAMGGRPVSCLNVVGFPDKDLPVEILVEILRGGSDKIREAGAVVAGGHSVRDSEIKYGLAVTGTIHPQKIVTNSGARTGDVLILTKPLGSGNLTTAFKKDKISEQDLRPCIEIMAELNRAACEAMLEVGVNAATDITGFGLIGHAYEMAAGSQVTVVVDVARVPLMDGVLAMAQQGMFTRAAESNLAAVGAALDRGQVDEVMVKILAEAQTSGGLLISVPGERADGLVRRLGVQCGSVVGEVVPRGRCSLALR